ncbi:helix-turn-helix domain-containing protein [uncultured Thiocystis sp.]|jgi:hypothetical protein|uniref:helix-turn-helix domain-containing protein n=1 Tax=uncultured Thiocystis sp. TaxID=1202134 RepID=UPI0025F42E8B|nr:helix-turn-helix domain-containing protein [uncultured Thiocystis sp.]
MARPAPLIDLTDEQRTLLEGISRRRETAHCLVRRARIVRRAADGEPNKAMAHALDLDEDGVGPWRRRWANAQDPFAALAGQPKRLRAAIEEILSDRPRSGNPGDFTAEQICQIVALACETPPDPLTHWTREDLVRETLARGIAETISASTIGRFLTSGRPQAPSHPVLAQCQDRRRGHLPGSGAHRVQTVPSSAGTP